MASSPDNISMAVFCDFENVALGVRDANYEKFDIKLVLERLLLKGSIVVKKAYCDWERYKGFKATMHEANFELIEIPHVRQSGKNSADIRLVVDALDLCYTKSHVNTFVIISGDSDFSPLVSKLRENNKQVIGVGVKQSTSDLLVAGCDEFIFYDDLVREVKRAAAKRDERKAQPAAQPKRAPDDNNRDNNKESSSRKEELEARKSQAIEMVVEMFDALVSERGDSGKIWASLLKDTLKRRRPDFNETYFGFRTFGNLLEEAQARGMLEFGRDEKSGAYVYRSERGERSEPAERNERNERTERTERSERTTSSLSAQVEQMANAAAAITYDADADPDEFDEIAEDSAEDAAEATIAAPEPRGRGRGRGRGGRSDFRAPVGEVAVAALQDAQPAVPAVAHSAPELAEPAPAQLEPRRRGRGGRTDFRTPVAAQESTAAPEQVQADMPAEPVQQGAADTPEWDEDSPFPPPAAGEKRRSPRAARKGAAAKSAAVDDTPDAAPALDVPVPAEPAFDAVDLAEDAADAAADAAALKAANAAPEPAPARKAARKPAARGSRPAKPKAAPKNG
ncbi:MAG: hypothetical protein JWR40_3737 [Massilia sp.]|nr:hypothetical protein [Massilia sp.]